MKRKHRKTVTSQEPLPRKGKRPSRGKRIQRRRLLAEERRRDLTDLVGSRG